jgi:hypothetical protein
MQRQETDGELRKQRAYQRFVGGMASGDGRLPKRAAHEIERGLGEGHGSVDAAGQVRGIERAHVGDEAAQRPEQVRVRGVRDGGVVPPEAGFECLVHRTSAMKGKKAGIVPGSPVARLAKSLRAEEGARGWSDEKGVRARGPEGREGGTQQ